MEKLLESRIAIAWFILTVNPAATHDCEMSMVYDNRIKDDADRYPVSFVFDGLMGWVDFESDCAYVTWGGMGLHLEAISGSELRKAIRDQTKF